MSTRAAAIIELCGDIAETDRDQIISDWGDKLRDRVVFLATIGSEMEAGEWDRWREELNAFREVLSV